MVATTALFEDPQNAVLTPRRVLQLHQSIVRVHPDKFIGVCDVCVDRLHGRVPIQPAIRLRAFRARTQAAVGAGAGLRAHCQLLDGLLDVLDASATPWNFRGRCSMSRARVIRARPGPHTSIISVRGQAIFRQGTQCTATHSYASTRARRTAAVPSV